MCNNFKNHLYNIPLNEISDDFIKNITGVGFNGKYANEFNDPNYDHLGRNRRIRSALFRNMSNQIRREAEKDGAEMNGSLYFNRRDPYNFSNHGDTVKFTNLTSMRNYSKMIHPNSKIPNMYEKNGYLRSVAATRAYLPKSSPKRKGDFSWSF